jgi:5-methylcytosine-specific restriction endonuclease McrA
MYKGAYGQSGSKFGWNIHHKKPKSQGGTDALDNLEIVHIKTHDEINGR